MQSLLISANSGNWELLEHRHFSLLYHCGRLFLYPII